MIGVMAGAKAIGIDLAKVRVLSFLRKFSPKNESLEPMNSWAKV